MWKAGGLLYSNSIYDLCDQLMRKHYAFRFIIFTVQLLKI